MWTFKKCLQLVLIVYFIFEKVMELCYEIFHTNTSSKSSTQSQVWPPDQQTALTRLTTCFHCCYCCNTNSSGCFLRNRRVCSGACHNLFNLNPAAQRTKKICLFTNPLVWKSTYQLFQLQIRSCGTAVCLVYRGESTANCGLKKIICRAQNSASSLQVSQENAENSILMIALQ